MCINVAQLLKEPVGSSRSYQINESIAIEDIDYAKGKITLVRTNRSILVKGAMTVSVTGICSRCLSPIDYAVNFNLEDEFFPRVDISSNSTSSGESDDSTIIDDNHVLDLNEVIRQYTLLTMPTKPLCRPDCGGLCQYCGHDLNQGPCQCSSRACDQRWSKLVRSGKESET